MTSGLLFASLLATLQAVAPDLTLTSVSAPASGQTAGTIVVENTVAASASGGAAPEFYVGVFLSTDAVITASDTLLGYRSVAALAAGASSHDATVVTLPANLATGTYYVGAIVDNFPVYIGDELDGYYVQDQAHESDESNNAALAGPIAIQGADLVIAEVSGPATGSSGSTIVVRNTVSAVGGGTGGFIVGLYLSRDATITTSDVLLGTRSVPGLAGGTSSTVDTTLTIPVTASGSYYLGAIADRNDYVVEGDETNNARLGSALSVIGPDLTISGVSGPATAFSGMTIAVETTVAATSAAGNAGSFSVGLYLSKDDVITTSDVFLGSRSVSSLAAGATSTATTSVKVPATIAPGTWRLGAIADHANYFAEPDETNNALAGSVIAVTGPDLVVSSMSGPAGALTGETITVTDTVTAQAGGADAGAFRVGFYLSEDAVITTSDLRIGERVVNGLAAGSSSSGTTSIAVPAGLGGGTYHLGAIVDWANQVVEEEEGNNALEANTVLVTAPDLFVASVIGPAAGLAGETIVVENTVEASVSGGAAPGFFVGVFLSSDAVITASDRLLGYRWVDGLEPGETSYDPTPVTLPVNLASGTYYLGVIADDFGVYIGDEWDGYWIADEAKESDETNNALAGGALVLGGADLVVAEVSGPADALTGRPVVVRNTVTSLGGGAGSFNVALYLSPDATITASDRFLGNRAVPGLAPGGSSTADTTVTIPAATAHGSYFLGAIADGSNYVVEEDDTNNALAGTVIAVTGSDLTISAVSGPAGAFSGATIAVDTSVTASSAGGDAGGFSVGIYLSKDDVVTTSDVFLGSRSVSSLAAGATSSASTNVTIPASVAPGSWRLGAIADYANYLGESEERNNALAGGVITVTGPDLLVTSVSGPAGALTGETISVADTVTAQAGAANSGPFRVGFYLSTDAVITTSDLRIGERVVNGLAAGSSSSGNTAMVVPAELAGGTYYLGAIVDWSSSVVEADEGNNARLAGSLLVTAPDLFVATVVAPTSALAGETIVVENTVEADVSGGAAPGFYVGIFLSSDAVITASDRLLGYRWVGGLAPGASSFDATAVTLPVNLPFGTYFVGAVADDFPVYMGDEWEGYIVEDLAKESDEANNALAGGTIGIGGADLVVAELSAPSTASTGKPLVVRNTVATVGAGTGPFKVAFYLSTDATITSADRYLGYRAVPGLTPGGSSTAETPVTVPAWLPPGVYHLGAIADSANQVLEEDESNNARTGNDVTISGSDLVVSAVSGPMAAAIASTVNVETTVSAAPEGGDAPGFTVGIYLSSDPTITTSDVRLATRNLSGLAAGASSAATTPVTIPANLAPGRWYLGAIVDCWNQVAESSETNNSLAGNELTVAAPDLTISAVAGPAAARTGEAINVANTVTAAPDGTDAPAFSVGLYLSSDTIITTSDRLLATRSVNGLSPGASDAASTAVTIPVDLPGGGYHLGAIADSQGKLGESDESNNARAGNAITIIGSDLMASHVSAPATAVAGSSIVVNDTITASAAGGSAPGFYVGVFLSKDAIIDGSDTLLAQRWVDGLVPGATSAEATTVTLPANLALGKYFLGVIADNFPVWIGDEWDGYYVQDAVKESDESNNARASAEIEITLPDLVVSEVSGPALAASGKAVTVRNAVTAAIGPTTGFSVALYLSRDANITKSDVYLGSRSVPGLAAGATSVADTSVTIPSATSPGKYYFGAIADSSNQVNESNESNNARASVEFDVGVDSQGPSILVSGVEDGQVSGELPLLVCVEANDPSGVASVEASLDGGAAFSGCTSVYLEGDHELVVHAEDSIGNASTRTVRFAVRQEPPRLVIAEPGANFVTTMSPVAVRGTATSASGPVMVTVNGAAVAVGGDGSFSTSVDVAPGPVTLNVIATDIAGRTTATTITGHNGQEAPEEPPPPPEEPPAEGALQLMVDAPADGAILGGGTVPVTGRVEGGTAPVQVTVAGVAASVTSGYFNAAPALVEGDHTLVIKATDAAGQVATAQRQVSVDHTAPYLAVTRPASSAEEATESPYLVRGTVGDVHLASVTVGGTPATLLGGDFSAAVPLQVGANEIEVAARDFAGNVTTRTLTLTVAALPPAVTILAPIDGSESATPIVKVRARVDATASLQSVSIGTGPAQLEGGEWVADFALAYGENVISVVATDASGLTGSASVKVRFSDATKEPLAVTGVDPIPGASEIEPSALVSVAFNKPIVRDSLAGHFTVSVEGTPLEGGYYVAPGAQTVSFVARGPLPEGKRLDVRVDGVEAEAGPDMSGVFTSQFGVRPRRFQLEGHVLDAQLEPLEDVLVSVEGTSLSTRTGPEGSWHLFGVKPGAVVVRFEGGVLGDGAALPVIRRRLFVSATEDTKDAHLVMVPVDRGAVDHVDARTAMHLTFSGRHEGLAIDVPADGLYFEDGKTAGFVTATRIPRYALPVPIDDGRADLAALWQVGPVGIRIAQPVDLTFPNVTALPAGRYALVYGYDPDRHMLARVGVARVAADGATLTTLEPTGVSALDFFGYGHVSDEQQAWLEATLSPAPEGTATPPPEETTGFRMKPAAARDDLPLLAKLLMLPLGGGRAQAFWDQMGLGGLPEPNVGTAFISGKIRSPQELEFRIDVTAGTEGGIVGLPHLHEVVFVARPEAGSSASIQLSMRAQRGQTVIAPPVLENWGQETPIQGEGGDVTVRGHVQLEPGTTLITAEAQAGRDSRTTRLEAVVTELPPDPSIVDPVTGKPERRGTLVVRQLVETDDSAASSGISFFSNWPVEVTSATSVRGVSGTRGQFSIPVFSYGSQQGALVCTEVQTGLRWIAQADRSDAESPKIVRYPITDGFPVCSNAYGVSPGSFSPVSLLVDMRLLLGSINFYNRDDTRVELACGEDEGSEWDPARNELTRIAREDVGQTEVYFFREDDLETPIARYTLATPPDAGQCTATSAHGEYKRLRFGPSERWTRRDREECDQLRAAGATATEYFKFRCEGQERILTLRLSQGDRIVVFAVNHATGYAGATTVVVPPITTLEGLDQNQHCAADDAAGGPIEFPDFGETLTISRCARQDLRVFGNVRLYPPEIDVRVARQVRAEDAATTASEHLVRHGGSATVRDEFVHVSTHWRVRLPPEDLDSDGTANLTDRCPTQLGPPNTFGCPDPNQPMWEPPPVPPETPVAPPALPVDGIPSTGGTPWPYQYSGVQPGPAVDPFDADGDGIPDITYDRDGDGTSDVADRCPLLAGDAASSGCPAGTDSDHDGTPDASEQAGCVLQPGPTTNAGCPDPNDPYWTPPASGEGDADGDGVADIQDLCPLYPGPSVAVGSTPAGCPSLVSRFDTDDDGTADPDDACIWSPGPGANHGCPDPAHPEWTPPPAPPRIAGGPGKMLERYCSELVNPTPDQIKICTKLEARLMDVPAGVPPLAGQLVRVTGTSVERPAVAVFPIHPGKGTSNIQAALRVENTAAPTDGTSGTSASQRITTNLQKASYYVHVVGNLTLFNDRNGDGRIDPATEIAVSPPAFSEPANADESWKTGMPERAIALKNVYRSLEPDGSALERFDRDREHEFRVLDLTLTSVTAKQADGTSRSVDDPADGTTAHAALDGDLSYQLLMNLVAPDAGRAGTLPGSYGVRLGSDAYGIECSVRVEAGTLTATCDGGWLYDVLSGRDVVYIGLSMAGNAENILYKYNLQGLSPRRDLVTAGHQSTLSKSITADAGGVPAVLRSISEPALANVFLGPAQFKQGTVNVCAGTCFGDGLIRSFDLSWADTGSFDVEELAGAGAIEQVPRAGVDGAALFRVPIPPHLVSMPGRAEAPPDVFVQWIDKADPYAQAHDVNLGKAVGAYQGANARAPGQAGIGGVNVADGHLSFRHEDFSLPELAGTVRFARTYNNQDNEIGTLGIGWRHNFEAYVVEESLGRYTMVLEGQSYDFPACTVREEPDGRRSAVECRTDNAHGGTLTVAERPETDPQAPKHIPDVLFTAPNGERYRFDRYSQRALQVVGTTDAYVTARSVQELAEYQAKVGDSTPIQATPPRKKIREAGRRRWVLTAVGDGHARQDAVDATKLGPGWTVVEYFADSDMIRRVYRKGGKLGLYFAYEPVDLASSVSPRFKAAAVAESFGFLKTVVARFQAGDGTPSGAAEDFIVRLSFAPTADGRRNLWKVQRIASEDKVTIDQAWEYAYVEDLQSLASAGKPLSAQDLWEATNELVKAELRLRGVVQWRTRWGRSLAASQPFPHTKLFEIVDRVVLPGTSTVSADTAAIAEVETKIDWVSATGRNVVRPDGVSVAIGTNAFGSVTEETIGVTARTTTWFNDASESERVSPSSRTAPGGRKLAFDTNERLLPTTLKLADLNQADSLDVAGAAKDTVLRAHAPGSYDPTFGVPEETTRATASGQATWETPVDDGTGDLRSLTVRDEAGTVLTSSSLDAYDADGRLLTAVDAVGRVTSYTYPADDPWGLGSDATTALQSVATGGRPSVKRTREYDWLGRLKRVYDDAGHDEQWTYDAAGRLERHLVKGTPDQEIWTRDAEGNLQRHFMKGMPDQDWHYLYAETGDLELQVTETLTGAPSHKRVKLYRDGLLVQETWLYGEPVAEAKRTFTYEGGRLELATDERAIQRDYVYDDSGRLISVTATDPGTNITATEVAYKLDGEGKVEEQTDQNGLVTSIDYDLLGRPASWDYGAASADGSKRDVETVKRDPSGAVVERTHGNFKWLSPVDALGRVKHVEAQVSGQLRTITTYDRLGRKLGSNDEVLGLVEEWKYDDVLGRQTYYKRSVAPYTELFEETRSYADGAAEHTVAIEEKVGGQLTKRRKLWLDATGRTLHTLDYVVRDGATLESHRYFEYDSRGNLVTIREPIGDVETEPDAPVTSEYTAVSTRAYDAAGNLIRETDAAGTVTAYVVDASGLVRGKSGPHPQEEWSYTYDVFRQLLEKKLSDPPAGSSPGWKGATWKYAYGGGTDFTIQETDPLGYVTKRWHNARHLLLKDERTDSAPGRTSTSQTRTVTYAYDGPWATEEITEEGSWRLVMQRSYDHRGRTLHESEEFTGPDATAYTYETSLSWSGRVAPISQSWTTGAGAGARAGERIVDALGNVTKQAWGGFADAWTWDAAGRLLRENRHAAPERRYGYQEGLLVSVQYGPTASQEETRYGHFASGRLLVELTPDLRERRLTWDARGLLATERFGRGSSFDLKEFTYDAAGNLASMKHGPGDEQDRWMYDYGPRAELVSVTQPRGIGKFQYAYDARGELTAITPASGGSAGQGFDYDYLGRQIFRRRGGATWTTTWANGAADVVDPTGVGTHRALDGRGRALVTGYSGVAGSDLTAVQADYDPLDQLVRVVETRSAGTTTISFAYGDDRRLLTGITRGAQTVSYARTASGQLDSVTSRDSVSSPAETIDYDYDPTFDRLQTIASGSRSTTLTWEAGGDRLLDVADGVLHECRRYDERGRVMLVSNVAAGESCELSESPLARYRYGYDERGNRTSEEYTGETVTVPELTSYGYDRADRLTGVAYADGTAKLYQLGGDGSRLAEKHVTPFSGDLGPDGWGVATGAVQTYGYDARGGLESITDEQGVAVVAYTVDLAGRVKVETRGTSKKELTWDAAGRLAEAKLGPAVAGGGGTVDTFTYRYDFAGRRIEKSGPTGDSRYLWGADDLVEEVAPSGTRLVYERMGGLVVGVSAYGAGGTPAGSERLMHDGLDTIVGRVRSDGSSSLYRYDAWGGFRGLGAPGAAEASLAYAGQHWDADVGLSYAQQRWYDPSVGRFLSEDPVFGDPTNPVSLHAWAYANGNPLAFIDPLGERAMTEAEKARDAEWYAEYLRRKAAWDKLPWYQKVGDVFDSDGNSQGAKVLARNINAYRRGIDQAADGEDVVAIDVAAEHGQGPVSITLPSGTQEMSAGPLVVPASKVEEVQAQRARNAETLAAMRGGVTASVAHEAARLAGASEEMQHRVTVAVGAASDVVAAGTGFGGMRRGSTSDAAQQQMAARAVDFSQMGAAAAPQRQPATVLPWSDEQLQSGIDAIHRAQFGNGGQGIPMAVTVTPAATVVVSQVGQVPGPAARAKATEIFGPQVRFVRGTTSSNAPGEAGQHAEARGIHFVGEEAQGARQASSHFACPQCEARQQEAGIINVTGTASQQGRITRPKKAE
ncbi:CARDB domain-containing protein [Anaeromyxobacter sp. Fw109-5]|uniref:CARDB domain-containing protein n=1 Tax=Anaeromyxobacter sp. (strain Fw109-5) TaxID=404589 RepID=UPI000158AB73|nr:CARDB domain-containing protein [Anaeromyxobacter sp. Fw109-5]ABS26527.1 YD repeat protein [Anaeromyxobacter sp. Fw109-5]